MLQKAAYPGERCVASRTFEIEIGVIVAGVLSRLVTVEGYLCDAIGICTRVAGPSLKMQHHGGPRNELSGASRTTDSPLSVGLEMLKRVSWGLKCGLDDVTGHTFLRLEGESKYV